MEGSIKLDRNVVMEMRDGVKLRANISRPDDNGKYPAILLRTPYNKDEITVVTPGFFGFARIYQDSRGRFASEGDWPQGSGSANVFNLETNDGYDSVEWIASQPWCDGNVGMMGGSYSGALQWTTAFGNPPHLKGIIPDVSPGAMMLDQTLFGGPLYLAFNAFWTMLMATDVANRLEKQGKDVSDIRKLLARAFINPNEVYNYLPLKDAPHFQLPGIREIWHGYLQGARVTEDPGEKKYFPYQLVHCPCMDSGGWYDIYTWSTFQNFLGVREKGATQYTRDNQHIYMGPWKHGAQTDDFLSELSFGGSSAVPGLLVGRESITFKPYMDFLNKHLRGKDVEIPVVRYFLMGKNEWKTADTWPLPGHQLQRFYLHSRGKANTATGDGILSRDEPHSESPDVFVYDPHNPVPTVGGRMIAVGGMIPGPRDQVYVEKRNDVLCYTTPELKDDIEVTGMLELHLFAATSARDTDFTVKLNDVYPDGRAYVFADGIIRARFRKSVFKPELVTPGEVNEYKINMGYTSICFKKGHRIRISITSSNFPAWDRNMNTGNPVGEDTKGIPAKQTIFHQPGSASYIDLPVIVTG